MKTTKRKPLWVRVVYYPRDEKQESKQQHKDFSKLSEAKKFIKQGLDAAEICSFYSLQKHYKDGE